MKENTQLFVNRCEVAFGCFSPILGSIVKRQHKPNYNNILILLFMSDGCQLEISIYLDFLAFLLGIWEGVICATEFWNNVPPHIQFCLKPHTSDKLTFCWSGLIMQAKFFCEFGAHKPTDFRFSPPFFFGANQKGTLGLSHKCTSWSMLGTCLRGVHSILGAGAGDLEEGTNAGACAKHNTMPNIKTMNQNFFHQQPVQNLAV